MDRSASQDICSAICRPLVPFHYQRSIRTSESTDDHPARIINILCAILFIIGALSDLAYILCAFHLAAGVGFITLIVAPAG